MKSEDVALRRKVLDELEYEPSVDATQIGVAANDGVVTLTGFVRSYPEKSNAERAARRVTGVKAVADELTIRIFGSDARTDLEIAKAAVEALHRNNAVPRDRVQVTAEHGWLTLDGEVEWMYQKASALATARYLHGVVGITDRIKIQPRAEATDVKSKIESAFARRAHLDAKKIKVEAFGGEVVLKGNARSLEEKLAAESAAWAAPGVSKVRNEVTVNAGSND